MPPPEKRLKINASPPLSSSTTTAASSLAPRHNKSNAQSTRKFEAEYDLRDEIGSGTRGQVRRAIHRKTGEMVAVKIIAIGNAGGRNRRASAAAVEIDPIQGRNLLAGEALRKEVRRGKKYDYWLFLDDDVDGDCSDGGYPMERLLGEGSCWQKIFNYIASDQVHVPEKASVVTLPNGAGTAGFVGFSSTDAMFAVPYLLPYVNLQEGSSEWTSQASLFCAMETCMKSSAVLVPFVGGINPALTREFIRGYNLGQIRQTIAVNYHDEQAGFFPCQGINPREITLCKGLIQLVFSGR